MYNIVRQNGQNVNLVIKPDVDCVVNGRVWALSAVRAWPRTGAAT